MNSNTMDRRDYKQLLREADALHKDDPDYKRTMNFEFALFLIVVLAIAIALRILVFEPVRVEGDSMFPTLLNGERMFVEKVSYIVDEPQRGEIIICYYPGASVTCVKRVVGLPGETVQAINGAIFINGEQLDESEYWKGEILGTMMFPVTVGEDEVFVVGDNRNASSDSRQNDIGPIPYSRVVGRARTIIWPLSAYRPL